MRTFRLSAVVLIAVAACLLGVRVSGGTQNGQGVAYATVDKYSGHLSEDGRVFYVLNTETGTYKSTGKPARVQQGLNSWE